MSRAAPSLYLALSISGCFGGGSLYGWSGYLPAVRDEFGVSTATVSMVFSLALVCFTFGVLLGPVLLAKLLPRTRLPLTAGLAALSLGGAGLSTSFAGFTLAYGAAFGFASGTLYNYTISLASASARPTLLVPVSVAAFGFGGAIFGPVELWLTSLGWGVWSNIPAMVCLAIVACIALVLPPSPVPLGALHTLGPVAKPNKEIAIIWVIFAAGSCSGLIVLGFASQFLPQGLDGIGFAGLAIFLAALGNTLGRLSSALTARWFGPARGIAAALVASILSLAGLIISAAPQLVLTLLFLVAFAYGQLAATTPLLVKSQVRAPDFAKTFGLVFTGWGVAGLVGPWSAGGLMDATGTLHIALIVCMALAGLSLWLVTGFINRDSIEERR